MASDIECSKLYDELHNFYVKKIEDHIYDRWNCEIFNRDEYMKNNISEEKLNSIELIHIGKRNLFYYEIEEHKKNINTYIDKLTKYQNTCNYKSDININAD
jgi:hypothetical protein